MNQSSPTQASTTIEILNDFVGLDLRTDIQDSINRISAWDFPTRPVILLALTALFAWTLPYGWPVSLFVATIGAISYIIYKRKQKNAVCHDWLAAQNRTRHQIKQRLDSIQDLDPHRWFLSDSGYCCFVGLSHDSQWLYVFNGQCEQLFLRIPISAIESVEIFNEEEFSGSLYRQAFHYPNHTFLHISLVYDDEWDCMFLPLGIKGAEIRKKLTPILEAFPTSVDRSDTDRNMEVEVDPDKEETTSAAPPYRHERLDWACEERQGARGLCWLMFFAFTASIFIFTSHGILESYDIFWLSLVVGLVGFRGFSKRVTKFLLRKLGMSPFCTKSLGKDDLEPIAKNLPVKLLMFLTSSLVMLCTTWVLHQNLLYLVYPWLQGKHSDGIEELTLTTSIQRDASSLNPFRRYSLVWEDDGMFYRYYLKPWHWDFPDTGSYQIVLNGLKAPMGIHRIKEICIPNDMSGELINRTDKALYKLTQDAWNEITSAPGICRPGF